MAKLTDEQKKEYLDSGGDFCPFCQSFNINTQDKCTEDYDVHQLVTCGDCEAEWYDVYSVTDVITKDGI